MVGKDIIHHRTLAGRIAGSRATEFIVANDDHDYKNDVLASLFLFCLHERSIVWMFSLRFTYSGFGICRISYQVLGMEHPLIIFVNPTLL